MARKTRKELEALSKAQKDEIRVQYFNDNKENWTKRVLTVVNEAQNVRVAENFEGFIVEFFVPGDPNDPNDYWVQEGYLPVNLELSDNFEEYISKLEDFEWRIEDVIRERAEAERKEKLRREALSKLSVEERAVLFGW